MLKTIEVYFLLFITYSILGWIMEVVEQIIQYRKFVNRGFLIGPYCPIYGFGTLAILYILKGYDSHPVELFINAIVICSLLEYFTSFLMEKIFHARWWDYSNKRFNINGRICLETMIPFGFGVLLVWYLINPSLLELINLIPSSITTIIAIILLIVIIIDVLISSNAIISYKSAIKKISKDDVTEDFNKYVKNTLSEKHYLTRRLIKAFPKINFEYLKKKIIKKNSKAKK